MSTEKNNKALWLDVYETNPAHTKPYNNGAFKGTSIASLACVERATEVFGPLGKGWDIEILEDQFIPGAPIIDTQTGAVLCNEQTHSILIRVTATYGNSQLVALGYGLTPHITRNNKGQLKTEHEAQKKSFTDAIKGALKYWGFSADVYMGLHDIPEYVEAMNSKAAIEGADDKAAEVIRQGEKYEQWKADNLRLIGEASTTNMLQGLFAAIVRKAKLNNDEEFIVKVTRACDKKKEELAEKATAATSELKERAARKAKEAANKKPAAKGGNS